MKVTHLLPLAALSTASVIRSHRQVIGDETSVWSNLPSVLRPMEEVVGTVATSIDQALEIIVRAGHNVAAAVDEWNPGRGGHSGDRDSDEDDDEKYRRGKEKRTIWEMIQDSKSARKFAKMIEQNDKLRKKLDDTKSEWTVFVPTDEAFRRYPGHEEDDKEWLEKIVEYHMVPRTYTMQKMMGQHTMPTILQETTLNREPQRIRISVGLFGVNLNFYSLITASNIEACNGYIHAIDNVLVPPPRQGKLINSLPGKFSTFALAMEKTEMSEELHKQPQRGGTIFAPTNLAWSKLGQRINMFLFSRRGESYLRALLKYHVVINETLYSDAIYEEERKGHDEDDERDFFLASSRVPEQRTLEGNIEKGRYPARHRHVTLNTLLKDRTIEVDVNRWMGLASMDVNLGKARVSIQDGVARDGVVQVIESVLIPPKHGGRKGHEEDYDRDFEHDLTVKELKDRLKQFVEGDEYDMLEDDSEMEL